MLIKVGRFYLTLGTFSLYRVAGGGTQLVMPGLRGDVFLEKEETTELERILDEAITAQKTVEQIVAEQRAQSEELQKRAEALQAREQYVEGIALQAQQIVSSAQHQNKSPILIPGFGKKRG